MTQTHEDLPAEVFQLTFVHVPIEVEIGEQKSKPDDGASANTFDRVGTGHLPCPLRPILKAHLQRFSVAFVSSLVHVTCCVVPVGEVRAPITWDLVANGKEWHGCRLAMPILHP